MKSQILHAVWCYIPWWGYRGNLKLITLGSERVRYIDWDVFYLHYTTVKVVHTVPFFLEQLCLREQYPVCSRTGCSAQVKMEMCTTARQPGKSREKVSHHNHLAKVVNTSFSPELSGTAVHVRQACECSWATVGGPRACSMARNALRPVYTCDFWCDFWCDFAYQTRLTLPCTNAFFAKRRVDWEESYDILFEDTLLSNSC